jgi:amino-acid N-acetyltransferase
VNNEFDIDGFRNAAPYITAHRGHCFVIAFGGEALDDGNFASLVHDFALLHSLGAKLVLVHGARPQIERRLQQQGLELRYVNGLRVTEAVALPCVSEAVGRVRVEIEALLSMGLVNTPMSGLKLRVASGNYVTAKPLGVRAGVDFGHTGEVRKVDGEAIRAHLEQNEIVLLSPLGYSPTGEIFNLSAEEVATAVSAALQAHKLILLLEGEAAPHEVLGSLLDLNQARALLGSGSAVPDGMRRAAEHAIDACALGVRRAHLLPRSQDGALL